MTSTDSQVASSYATANAVSELHITISDCNSIATGNISLQPGSLNIKYGPNGIGKSTIARALTLRTEGEERLEELTPFKYRALKDTEGRPPSFS